MGSSQEDLQAQFELWQEVNAKLSETHQAVKRLRRARERVKSMAVMVTDSAADEQAKGAIQERAEQITVQLGEVEGQLVQPKAKVAYDRLRLHTMLNAKLHNLISVVSSADERPPQQTYDVSSILSAQTDEQLDKLNSILDESLADFNAAVQRPTCRRWWCRVDAMRIPLAARIGAGTPALLQISVAISSSAAPIRWARRPCCRSSPRRWARRTRCWG